MAFQLGHKVNEKHGHGLRGKQSRTYSSWSAMLTRCRNVGNKDYQKYGAQGIKVCKRWNKFENFLKDMGIRPKGKTLDRWPHNQGNYSPRNCRWATPQEQADNRKIVHIRRIRDSLGRFRGEPDNAS